MGRIGDFLFFFHSYRKPALPLERMDGYFEWEYRLSEVVCEWRD